MPTYGYYDRFVNIRERLAASFSPRRRNPLCPRLSCNSERSSLFCHSERSEESQRHSPTLAHFGNRNAPAVMAFTLEGTADNTLGSGRGLADPDIVGWWSKSFCSDEPEKKDGVPVGSYPFAQPPTLTVDFGSPRPVRIVQIYGDVMLGEFPTRLRIRLFRGADKYAAGENCREVVYDNSSVQAEFDLTKDADGNAITGLVNGYVNGITHMTVEILAWNKPARMSKIYRCYDDIIERYGSDELKCFECIRELPDSDGLSYGLVSGSCSVTLHNKDRKFDRGYLKTLAHINKRVVPYINGEKLGSFYIKEWDISQSDMFVKCDANDRLLDFQDMMYDGRMPRKAGEKLGFKTLFEEVLENARNRLVQGFNYSVDKELDEWAVEPYLPRKSVWDVLRAVNAGKRSFASLRMTNRHPCMFCRTEFPRSFRQSQRQRLFCHSERAQRSEESRRISNNTERDSSLRSG